MKNRCFKWQERRNRKFTDQFDDILSELVKVSVLQNCMEDKRFYRGITHQCD